jgi:hypothetical protein
VKENPDYYVMTADEETVRGVRPRLDLLAALHPYGVVAGRVAAYLEGTISVPDSPADD